MMRIFAHSEQQQSWIVGPFADGARHDVGPWPFHDFSAIVNQSNPAGLLDPAAACI